MSTLRLSIGVIGTIAVALAALNAKTASAFERRDVIKELGGKAVSCSDAYGRHVHAVLVTNLGDVGRARQMQRTPIIMMDPHYLNPLPSKLQLFFFGHECAHHVLGHVYVVTPTSEMEADCWAAKDGRDRGLFTRDDVQSWGPWFAKSRGSKEFGHLPGPERAAYLLTCFDEKSGDDAKTVTARE